MNSARGAFLSFQHQYEVTHTQYKYCNARLENLSANAQAFFDALA
jgi:hypothetical protein